MTKYVVRVKWVTQSGKHVETSKQIDATNEAEAEIMTIRETKKINPECAKSYDLTAKIVGKF